MLIYEENLHKKVGAISQLRAEKITFHPKPDRHKDGRTDIYNYRVASLLKSGNYINIVTKILLLVLELQNT